MGSETLADRLKAAREARGLTVKQFATRAGVKASTVEAWENGRNEPRGNKLMTLAGLLGVQLAWLLRGGKQGPVRKVSATTLQLRAINRKVERAQSQIASLSALVTDISANLAALQRELGK